MTREEVRAQIETIGVIPSIRSSSREDAVFAAEAVASGGIPIVEVTMTVEGALEVIDELARVHPEIVVGAGTVLDVETARRCLDAGACFVTSPGFDPEIVEFALKQGIVTFPGALTPSEVMLAWKAGSDFVKVFPCAQLGGPDYIKTLKAPFPQIPLIATGGVNQQTVGPSIHAGAVAVGVGASLIHPRAIAKRERQWIIELANRYRHLVSTARSQLREPSK